MKPTMAILERISKNSQENIDEVFTRLYRYLLRPDIYYVATRLLRIAYIIRSYTKTIHPVKYNILFSPNQA